MAAVDLVTLAEVKAQLEITDSSRDTAIIAMISAASRAINRRYSRELTPKTASATRRFRVPIRNTLRLVDFQKYELRTATTVTLNPQGSPQVLVADTEYILRPIGGAETTATFLELQIADDINIETEYSLRFGFGLVEIAGAWGAWDTADVLEDVKRACIACVGAWLDRAVAQYGLTGLDDPRGLLPTGFGTWAIPAAAHSLLVGAGIPRTTAV